MSKEKMSHGKDLRRYKICVPVNQAPVVDGNSITVADLDGNISRIEVS